MELKTEQLLLTHETHGISLASFGLPSLVSCTLELFNYLLTANSQIQDSCYELNSVTAKIHMLKP